MSLAEDEERRTVDRFEIATEGHIILPSGSRVPFSIVDISQRGAQLRLNQLIVLPSEFIIDVMSPDRKKVKRCDCKRTWQRNWMLGVKFITARMIELDNYVN